MRKSNSSIPEDYLEAFNSELDRDTDALLSKDILMEEDALERAIRREEAKETEKEEEAREMYLRRFHKEREEVRKQDDSLTRSRRQRWENARKGMLFVDHNDIPPNEVWVWAAEKIRNQPNEDVMSELLNKGYVPVRPSEYNRFQSTSEYAAEFGIAGGNLIRKGGSVLMKIAKDIWEEEREYMDEGNKQVRNSVDKLSREIGHQHGVATMGVVRNETERTTRWNSKF